jgi:hypothetical protein
LVSGFSARVPKLEKAFGLIHQVHTGNQRDDPHQEGDRQKACNQL